MKIDNKEIVTKIISLEDLNEPILKQGKLPESQNECVVEESFLKLNNKVIGDTIKVDIEDSTNDEGENVKYLKDNELKIVGTVKSPLYISRDRGNSKLGAGKVNYYIYMSEENINANSIYTSLYIKVKNAENLTTSSDEYEKHIENVKQSIEQIKTKRENARHDQLVDIASKKVQEAEKEFNNEKQSAESKIADAEKQIEDGKQKIKTAEEEINKNNRKADIEFANAKLALDKAKEQINTNESELKNKEQEANSKFKELEMQKQKLQVNLEQLNKGIDQLQSKSQSIDQLLKDQTIEDEQKKEYENQQIELKKQIQNLEKNKQEITVGITTIETGISTGKKEIENGKIQIQNAKKQITQKETQYNQSKKVAYAKIQNAKVQLEQSKQEITKGEQELNKNTQEFEEKIASAEKELVNAREKITEIKNPKWYILDRNSNAGYVSFIQDSNAIENIGKVFPVVFFIVAALISLTSMTRMVEEQRMQIGTLKALGYNKLQITGKYIIYASLACIIGGIFGMCIGFIILPKIIWAMYGMMYQITDNISIDFNMKYGGMGLLLMSLCIIGATVYTVLKELVNTPATLMRPKAPKMGNRVFLERIHFIWKRLNFSHKVTVRNIFRYKKRFFMTIIGILGCTALILTGFGVKDSVKKILPNQFGNVFCYDMQINLKNGLDDSQKNEYISKLQERTEIEKTAETQMLSNTAIKEENEEEVQIIISKDENALDEIININDIKTKEKVKLEDNQICLTDKAAQLLGVKQGDNIILKDSDEKEIEVTISNIVENYVSHYVYMSKETYEKLYNQKYETNVILTKNINLNDEEQDALATEIMNQSEVASIMNVSSTIETIDNMMSLLNYVVIVLIISAGLLAFVVLYNLSNVNISERVRELATIKVLGFYDKEVYSYVTRETVILTIIGIILGLFAGYFLNYYIMGTCEINILRFTKTIEPISYVYAVVITVIFTIIVNIATYFSLKKIDMISSLKSVE